MSIILTPLGIASLLMTLLLIAIAHMPVRNPFEQWFGCSWCDCRFTATGRRKRTGRVTSHGMCPWCKAKPQSELDQMAQVKRIINLRASGGAA